ncbi:UDP-N-acetylglucosamine 1-carboxyvinyltransferase [Rubrivirga litoralis]|uniref:UDP-N-acetylglucosamine 1-carboxyvinyltransferase n=1 Tax=Rubrivirga litoralis TaxID=3075598 RepID=A0ABU3BSP4_9BACT|nr:UDP-N-acetylglucosamine 1-carboxyvinyltransferase [Rubrivirga sp. F394]MDT0632288.1 UDP-N-acetylglucosamine 1-carboxyvinyltransferase [Rubrivirga sp. F394]
MDKLVVHGGRPLTGTLHVGGSKNTALPLMAAAVLADGATTIHNIPVLQDVATFANVIRVTGCTVDWNPDDDPNTPESITIDASGIHHFEAPYDLVKKMRASFYMLGALLGRGGKARVSLPGGCAWGPRPVDLHIEGMKALGAEIREEGGYVIAEAPGGRLKGGRMRFEPVSVGATINVLLAAVTAEGETVLENTAAEPDVVVFGQMLQAMGAQIDGLGTDTITVQGVERMNPVEFTNCPDRIELGTYMIAAALATPPGETLTITGAQPEHLGPDFTERFRETGVPFEFDGDVVRVTGVETVRPVSVETAPYPGFATDLQAQWTVLMAQADGPSTVRDTVYTDRFKHVPELRRLGADLQVKGDTVEVAGRNGRPLSGATVMSTDLRASVSLVLAGMVAEGTTNVLRVYHLDRGYERIEHKLQGAGVDIAREQYDEAHAEGVPA